MTQRSTHHIIPDFLLSFGRRQGRTLRPQQKALLADVMPQVEVRLQGENIAPASFFAKAPKEVWMEIGFGGGEFLAKQATLHPDIGIIGCEPYINGVVKLLAEVAEHKFRNVAIWRDDARMVLKAIKDHSLHRVFILFPDPWPKIRHQKRRIVSHAMLELLSTKLVPGGELVLATDHVDYAEWMFAHVLDTPYFTWNATSSADWKTPPEGWTTTRYEEKTRAEGREPVFIRCVNKGVVGLG